MLGQTEYLVQSNDSADCVSPEDRFRYIDDLSLVQLVCLAGLVSEYNFSQHVASDVGIDQVFLPAANYETQNTLDTISQWTDQNLMKINAKKSYYMTFSRSEIDFATRLSINNTILEQKRVVKLLGVWIEDTMSWSRNCKELTMKAYSRLSMLTKLKYVGVGIEDLLEIYKLFIRSVLEYCSVAFHSSLTMEQTEKLERIQKTCLKVIIGDMYISYNIALEMCNLETLSSRRQKRCLNFSLKCLKYPQTAKLFPLRPTNETNVRDPEVFSVNFAKTSTYKKSAIPFCQRLLNEYYYKKKKQK